MADKNRRNVRLQDPKAFTLSAESPFSVQEGYKALRSNVTFSLPGGECKIIGVTSANRGDRKSTTAVNLGISYAEIGKRVLLVDCDMRLPTLASRVGIPAAPGITDVLVDAAELTEVVHEIRPNLYALPAGRIPRDPTGLLSSRQMAEFLAEARAHYDYIFLDFPPINTVTDAAILAAQVDGYLLMVTHASTTYRDINGMLRLLKLAGANVLGFVYNDAPLAEKKYYSHSYGYNNA